MPRGRQLFQGGNHAVVRARAIAHMEAIVLARLFNQLRLCLIVQRSVSGQGITNKLAKAVPHKMPVFRQGVCGIAMFFQYGVAGIAYVSKRIEQGAVKVKEKGFHQNSRWSLVTRKISQGFCKTV